MENYNLKYDAASYSLTSSSSPSNELNHVHNDNIIENLQIADLLYLEKDLDFYEKVSLMFLCYGNERSRAAYALQQLQTGQYRPDTTFLTDWAIAIENSPATQPNDCWKKFLIEALCIIKANYVLIKLGLCLPELSVQFLPQNTALSLNVHPVLKALFCMCEQLTQTEANEMINKIEANHSNDDRINFDENYLEIYMLKWLSNDVIAAGEWIDNEPIRQRQIHCNVDCILQYLKESNKDLLRTSLQSVQISMNFTSENRIKGSKCESKNSKKFAVDEDSLNKFQMPSVSELASNNWLQKISISTVSDNNNYRIRRDYAGQVLIINQKDFYTTTKDAPILEKRLGTDSDKCKLIETFHSRGFKIYEVDNATSFDIISSIRQLIKKNLLFDSLIICILSHGNEGFVYGSDSLPVKIDDLRKEICVESLINKPKILIIQACQGESMQKAYPVHNDNDSKLAFDGPTKRNESTAAVFSDFLVVQSTITGFKSIRHEDNGSWFIQTLCENINGHNCNDVHFLDIVTSTISQVSEKRAHIDLCQVPQYTSAFRKRFYLPDK